ncbi:MAG: hypothetical protein M0R74_02525 [Dehalococcoidia bacterium]|nr:hypothetical protein [Dehalococcoidia bacterium]
MVWRGDGEAQAEVVAGQLRARGIDALPTGIRPGSAEGALLIRSGTWAISVPARDAVAARRLLRQAGEGPLVIEGESPGKGLSRDQQATLVFAALGVLAVVAYLVYAAAKGSL